MLLTTDFQSNATVVAIQKHDNFNQATSGFVLTEHSSKDQTIESLVAPSNMIFTMNIQSHCYLCHSSPCLNTRPMAYRQQLSYCAASRVAEGFAAT